MARLDHFWRNVQTQVKLLRMTVISKGDGMRKMGWEERLRALDVTLPSERVSLNGPGFEDQIHPRGRRGGGN
ncbi:MAG: hypothetical protein ACLQGT_11255, partial [Terracidiphilus sp.]